MSEAKPEKVEVRIEDIAGVLDVVEDVRDREVLERFFGLGGREAETLESIGESMGFTRARAWQIKQRAVLACVAELRARGTIE